MLHFYFGFPLLKNIYQSISDSTSKNSAKKAWVVAPNWAVFDEPPLNTLQLSWLELWQNLANEPGLKQSFKKAYFDFVDHKKQLLTAKKTTETSSLYLNFHDFNTILAEPPFILSKKENNYIFQYNNINLLEFYLGFKEKLNFNNLYDLFNYKLLKNIDNIKNKTSSVFIFSYPLIHPGYLAIIDLLAKNIDVHVWAAFDQNRMEDFYFYPAFLNLGELANHTQMIEGQTHGVDSTSGGEVHPPSENSEGEFGDHKSENVDQTSSITSGRDAPEHVTEPGLNPISPNPAKNQHFELSHPLEEILLTVQKLKKALQTNPKAKIGVMIPDDGLYLTHLAFSLKKANINWQLSAELLLKDPQLGEGLLSEELDKNCFFSESLKPVTVFLMDDPSFFAGQELYILGFSTENYPYFASAAKFWPVFEQQKLLSQLKKTLGPTQLGFWQAFYQNIWQNLKIYHPNAIYLHPKQNWNDRLVQARSDHFQKIEWELGFLQPPLKNKNDYPKIQKNKFSVTELALYQKCPQKYYLRYQLGIAEEKPITLDLAKDLEGRILHRVLELYWLDQIKNSDFTPKNQTEITLKIAQLVKQVIQKQTEFSKAMPILAKEFTERLSQTLVKSLVDEYQAFVDGKKLTLPYQVEWAFGRGKNPYFQIKKEDEWLYLSGRIDRIDYNAQNQSFSVIDFKSGSVPSSSKIADGEDLQLILYSLAVQKLLFDSNAKPASLCYYSYATGWKASGISLINSGEEELLARYPHLSEKQFLKLTETATNRVFEIKEKINKGEFEPNPESDFLCQFCGYAKICSFGDKKLSEE